MVKICGSLPTAPKTCPRACPRRVYLRPNADEPCGRRELHLVRLCVQRDDTRVYRFAAVPTRAVLRHDPRPNLHFHPEPQYACQDGRGVGMRMTMYSFTASKLYLSCAERSARWAMTPPPYLVERFSQCVVHETRARTFYECRNALLVL